jgi:hypothetical protein
MPDNHVTVAGFNLFKNHDPLLTYYIM